MAGTNISHQNIIRSITLPQLACLRPIMHPGARSSPGKQLTCTWRKRKHNSSDQTIVFHSSMVQFWCPLLVLSAVSGVSMDTLTALLLCSHIHNNCDALCIRTPLHQNQHFFSSLSYTYLVCRIRPHRPAFTPHMREWVLAAHDAVAYSPLYQALHIRTTPQQLQFCQMLWQAPNSLQSLHLSIFPACNVNFEDKMFTLLSNVSLTGPMMKSVFFTPPGHAHNVMPHLPRILFSSLLFHNLVCSYC